MEFQNNKAIWQQIADQIISRILSKEWLPNERIPSVRELGAELQVNPNTVVRSYTYLQDEGLILNQRGIGYFVAENGLHLAIQLRKKNFIEEVLPVFFEYMEELGLTFEHIQKLYELKKSRGHSE